MNIAVGEFGRDAVHHCNTDFNTHMRPTKRHTHVLMCMLCCEFPTMPPRVMADPSLSPFFSHYTPHALRPKLVSFLAFSLGTNPQSVEELQAVHAPLLPRGLTMSHYDSVLEHFLTTTQQLRVDQALVSAAHVNLTAMRVVFVDLLERATVAKKHAA